MYTSTEERSLGQFKASITRTSAHPIPWTKPKAARPDNYYAQIETVIHYERHGKNIVLTIPAVEASRNHERTLHLTVDGVELEFSEATTAVLDMSQTFDLVEMQRLLQLTGAYENHSALETGVLRFFAPFFYGPKAKYTKSDLSHTHGNLPSLLRPFLQQMQKECYRHVSKELYFPMVTKGIPHHWLLILLRIDDNNKATITYGDTQSDISPETRQPYLDRFFTYVLPEVNRVLAEIACDPIEPEAVQFTDLYQFSERGCGITIPWMFERLVAGTLPAPNEPTARVDIVEDALLRAELALALHKHEELVTSVQAEVAAEYPEACATYRQGLKAVLRELTTSERTLSLRAQEQGLMEGEVNWRHTQDLMRKHIDLLRPRVGLLLQKADPEDPLYQQPYAHLEVHARALLQCLDTAEDLFFNELRPCQAEILVFREQCYIAIAQAKPLFKEHRGLWFQLAPIFRIILGILATLTVVPATAVALFAPQGYIGTFFATPKTQSEEALGVFEEGIDCMGRL